MSQDEGAVTFTSEEYPDEDYAAWLAKTLGEGGVRAVFYETRFFVDPAQYRELSPETRFVVLCAPGEESLARDAITRGAQAILEKPVDPKEFRGVLSLVSG